MHEGQARAVQDVGLQDQPLGDHVDQRAGNQPAGVAAAGGVTGVVEQRLVEAGQVHEAHQVGLGDRAGGRPEGRPRGHILPREPLPQERHIVTGVRHGASSIPFRKMILSIYTIMGRGGGTVSPGCPVRSDRGRSARWRRWTARSPRPGPGAAASARWPPRRPCCGSGRSAAGAARCASLYALTVAGESAVAVTASCVDLSMIVLSIDTSTTKVWLPDVSTTAASNSPVLDDAFLRCSSDREIAS